MSRRRAVSSPVVSSPVVVEVVVGSVAAFVALIP